MAGIAGLVKRALGGGGHQIKATKAGFVDPDLHQLVQETRCGRHPLKFKLKCLFRVVGVVIMYVAPLWTITLDIRVRVHLNHA